MKSKPQPVKFLHLQKLVCKIRLGEAGTFWEKSAIIQMPTSSGKTTSMSIAIRAAFSYRRTSMAVVVVASFRPLCREISDDISNDFLSDSNVHVNALSDVLEIDDRLELLESFGESISGCWNKKKAKNLISKHSADCKNREANGYALKMPMKQLCPFTNLRLCKNFFYWIPEAHREKSWYPLFWICAV